MTEADQLLALRNHIERWKQITPESMFGKRFYHARAAGVVPYSYLLTRCAGNRAFKHDKRGVSVALRACTDILKKTGELTPANLQGYPGEYFSFT